MITPTDLIASFALIISLAAFYLQFFHKRDAVIGRASGTISSNRLTAQITLSNPGTRPILLSEASLVQMFDLPQGGGVGFAMSDRSKFSPILIPRDEFRIFSLEMPVPNSSIKEVENFLKNRRHSNGDDLWPVWVQLDFITVSGRKLKIRKLVAKAAWRSDGGMRIGTIPECKWEIDDRPIDDRGIVI